MALRKLLRFLVGIAALATMGQYVDAQQTSTPILRQRTDPDVVEQRSAGRSPGGRQFSTLPDDVSGSYNFNHLNESIEIDVEHNRLTGYISQLGDAETDDNTPLTFFFDRTSIHGDQIEFETRVLHGLWYSFRGTILHGRGETRGDEGYYVLAGELEAHHSRSAQEKSADETIETRSVHFKSMPQ